MQRGFTGSAVLLLCLSPAPAQSPADLAQAYAAAVRKVNEEHAKAPGKNRETDLAKRLPASAEKSLEQLLAAKGSPDVAGALVACGEAALDLDLVEHFDRVRARLEKEGPAQAKALGSALSRPRYVLRGLNGLDRAYLEKFAELMDAVLTAYDELFGFGEWSKVPGKKLRVRVHLEAKITRPPHFAPQFPFHSEIDFPVIDAEKFKSPTADGKFLFYGLCHELGHVIAMWGDPKHEEDHHSWAHYTGVAVVEHLSKRKQGPSPEFLKSAGDVGWRSLEKERKRLEGKAPSTEDADGVLSLLVSLHDRVGPKAIGEAINALDEKDKRLRVNRVRYYSFKELRGALLEVVKDQAARAQIQKWLPQ
jgi:hypothetical protein